MVNRQAVLRFDVDTELCLRAGAAPLCRIAESYGVPLTFFVNPGRAVDRPRIVADLFHARGRGRQCNRAPSLSAKRKLGYWELVRLLVTNPRVLPRQAEWVRRLFEGGHHVGLHGGRNHATWQRGAMQWSEDRVEAEVAWGKLLLEQAAGHPITSFASPGWTSPPALPDVLARNGFSIIADDHEPRSVPGWRSTKDGQLLSVPNTLAGEPGGVGYFESLRASGLDSAALLTELERVVREGHSFLCVYDHPFYVGRRELAVFEGAIEMLLAHGYTVVTPTRIWQDAVSG